MRREDMLNTGLVIGREVKAASGTTYIRLDSPMQDKLSVVVRDQNDENFFIIDLYDRSEADDKINQFARIH